MQNSISSRIAFLLNTPQQGVENVIRLFDEGASIPFVARYRKELSKGMDELVLAQVQDLRNKLEKLEKRRESILEALLEKEVLTPELKQKIELAADETELEDLYLPFKTKRKTKADKAREAGLEPLAKILMAQNSYNPLHNAQQFVCEEYNNAEAALDGAKDIIAEWINESILARQRIRSLFERNATMASKLIKNKEEEAQLYRDYWDMEQDLKRIPSHRFLAMKRAEKEGFLRVGIDIPKEMAYESLERIFIKGNNPSAPYISEAIKDAYKRLLKPAIETEFFASAKEKADDDAIRIFVANLEQLLLTAPIGEKRTLAIDPGFRTGCKLVCINEQGELLHNETIYPHPPQNESGKAASKIAQLVKVYGIQAMAIGNGTAGRETENFIKKVRFENDVEVYVVNEAGASIYSASKIARDEFPNYDVTVRGAVSIGRRLQDPLAELVKIDPKSIGVGQYQHDVDQNKLQQALNQCVERAVNRVGVNLNTASEYLLRYVSGVGPALAKSIVEYRTQIEGFTSRKELLSVPKLGKKAFEQSAGFLRIQNASNPLDNSAVHPERYALVEKMAKDIACKVSDLLQNDEKIKSIDIQKYVSDDVGLPTLKDIVDELKKPGRDPRKKARVFAFDPRIKSIEDLKEGMILEGLVGNLTNFGAFINLGIKQNGLVHISEIANEFISNPAEKLHIDQIVKVKVLEIDTDRNRIALSIKQVE
jgi:uncharacterized protein